MNLTAKKDERYRNTLRTYFAEMWAEAHRDEEMVARDDSLDAIAEDYELGNVYVPDGYKHMVQFASDVQKHHYWWLARAWSKHEKTGAIHASLIDFGTEASIVNLDATAGEIKPDLVGIDIGYALKATEVGAYCASYVGNLPVEQSQVMALRGSDQLKKMPIDRQIRDAYEGGRGAKRALFFELTWNTDVFRTMLMDAINGRAEFGWCVPKEHQDEERWHKHYVKQITSTRKADGEWIVEGHGQDHLFDCEAMQIVLAQYAGLIQ